MDDKRLGWRKVREMKLDRVKLARRMRRVESVTQKHAHRFIIRRIENVRLASRQIITWILLVGLVVAGMGLQLIWNQKGFMTEGHAAGGLYVEGVVGPLGTLNPIYAATGAEASVARLVFSSLYDYDSTGTLRQDVASGMSIDQSGKVYTVTLRDDVRWHDGQKLTAEDIVFTINTIKNSAVRSPLRINWIDVDVKVVNDTSVVFTLPATYASFPQALTFPVLPEHLLKSVAPAALRESTFSQDPVGSGPFEFKRFQAADTLSRHQAVHLVANTDYYRGAPKLDRFELQVFDNETSLLVAVKNGEVNGASDVSPTSVGSVGTRYNVSPLALSSGVYLIFNTNNQIFKDKAVRQALQVGTDTATLRTKIGGGVLALDLPILPGQLSGVDVPHAPSVDVGKARSILDAAGWKLTGSVRAKDGQTLSVALTTSNKSEYEKAAQLIKEQWRELGVSVDLRVVDSSSASSVFVQDTLQGRNFDILLYELAIGADPDVYAYWHSSQIGQTGYNFSGYSNPVADASLSSARSRLEPTLRSAKYKVFAERWLDDAPAIALYQPVVEYVTNKNANTVDPDEHLTTEADRYANVIYWTVSHKAVYKTP